MTNERERRRRSGRGRRPELEQPRENGPTDGAEGTLTEPGTTGRWLVLFREETDAVRAGTRALAETAGLRVVSAADYAEGAVDAAALAEEEALVFPELGVAVVSTPPPQLQALGARAAEETGILALEPERIVFALEGQTPVRLALPGSSSAPLSPPASTSNGGIPVEYLRAYQAGVNAVVEHVLSMAGVPAAGVAEVATLPETELTWGLQVTNVGSSQFSGRDVRVAILDTGIDLEHPDFIGRQIVSRSFILGQEVQDGHGHGTHVAGTACGPKQPGQLPG